MFQTRIKQLGEFRKLINLVKELFSEVLIEVSPSGFYINALNELKISQIHLHLAPGYFEEFKADSSVKIGVSLDSFCLVLRLGGPEDTLTMQSDLNVLTVTLEARNKICDFQLGLYYVEESALPIDEENYDEEVTMNALDLQRICTDLSQISDFVIFKLDELSLKLSIDCEEAHGDISFNVPRNDPTTEHVIMLNLAYLKQISKAFTVSNTAVIGIKANKPARFKYSLVNAELLYYLAPAIIQ